LFVAFTLLALQGFGGVVAVVQQELIDRRGWLTKHEFVEDWGVAQIMPGPNIVNFAIMFGERWFGIGGAVAAVAGLLLAPLALVLGLGVIYARFSSHPGVAGALRGMGAVAAGLIGATGIKLLDTLRNNRLGIPLCAALASCAFVAIALLHWPLLYVLLVTGGVGGICAYRKLTQ
jgi:chromate transporter